MLGAVSLTVGLAIFALTHKPIYTTRTVALSHAYCESHILHLFDVTSSVETPEFFRIKAQGKSLAPVRYVFTWKNNLGHQKIKCIVQPGHNRMFLEYLEIEGVDITAEARIKSGMQ